MYRGFVTDSRNNGPRLRLIHSDASFRYQFKCTRLHRSMSPLHRLNHPLSVQTKTPTPAQTRGTSRGTGQQFLLPSLISHTAGQNAHSYMGGELQVDNYELIYITGPSLWAL